MVGVAETLSQSSQVHASLSDGTDVVSDFQVVRFEKYVRLVLPVDGSVFWVRAALLTDQMLYSAYLFNAAALGDVGASSLDAPIVFDHKGDLHYSTANSQQEADSDVTDRIVFTAREEVENLQDVGPYVMYVAEVDGIRYSFSQRGRLQQNAGTYHYSGTAVLASMDTQLVDSPSQLNTRDVVVSNSLPYWLSLNGYQAEVYEAFSNYVSMYPSFLIPNNLPPPYVSVHVDPTRTRVLAAVPSLGSTLSHEQLCADVVKFTLCGLRSDQTLDFMDFLLQGMRNGDAVGLMSLSPLRDMKKGQVELGVLAQRKELELEVSYLQSSVRNVARQYVVNAFVSDFIVKDAV